VEEGVLLDSGNSCNPSTIQRPDLISDVIVGDMKDEGRQTLRNLRGDMSEVRIATKAYGIAKQPQNEKLL